MRMKYVLTAALFVAFCLPVFGQDMIELTADWKVGEKKTVTTEASSQMTLNGSLISDEKVTTTCELEVLRNNSEYVTLSYRVVPGKPIETEAASDGDSVQIVHNELQELLLLFDENISRLNYMVQLRKEDGVAEEILNWDELSVEIEEMVYKLVDHLSQESALPISRDSLRTVMNEMMIQRQPEMEQTILNSVTSMFQVYAYSYPKNGSHSFAIEAYAINQLGVFADEDLPATVTIDSKRSGNSLKAHIDMQYDKEYLLNAMKQKSPQFADLEVSDLVIVETEDVEFNLSTNWIRTQVSVIQFELPMITVTENITVTFR